MQGKVTASIHSHGDGSVASTTITMAHPVFHGCVEKARSQWKWGASDVRCDGRFQVRRLPVM
jgi:hypothetical protein